MSSSHSIERREPQAISSPTSSRRLIVSVVMSVLLAVGFSVMTPSPSGATEPHSGGYREALPLTWIRYDPMTDSAALVAGRVDGSRQRQLTHPAPGIRDSEPIRSR